MSKFTLDAPTRLAEGWEVPLVKVKEGQDEDGRRSRYGLGGTRRDGGGHGENIVT